ncbi:MAG: aldehyde dehydrogenase family protein [Solirubrobacterales bacterium]|nr:aldehyde dehydrogenase family protein [Solirubrobacterales bacterium]
MSTTASAAGLEVRSPYDGALISTLEAPDADAVQRAVAGAAAAAPAMAALTADERSELLYAASQRIAERTDELAVTIAREAGKPIREARAEASRAKYVFRWAAEETKRIAGEWLPLDTEAGLGRRGGLVRRFPVGPLLAVAPFNFPLNLVAHKLAPALAAGNPVIVKPSTRTPLSAVGLAEAVSAGGDWPEGAITVLAVGGEITSRVAGDPRIAAISFTGSDRVGWELKAANPKKKITLELGGNSAVIVEPDADLEFALARLVFGAFAYAGQVCLSTQRILVADEIYDEFVARYVAGVQALVVGDPLDESTDVGPMITADAAGRVQEWVDEARDMGATVQCGGSRTEALFSPTVLTELPHGARCWGEEIFGPVVSISRYGDFDEALALANGTRYGLQAAVFTQSLDKAMRAHETIRAGGIIVNDAPFYRAVQMPYGGLGDSGHGREGVTAAIREMTEPRLLVIPLPGR